MFLRTYLYEKNNLFDDISAGCRVYRICVPCRQNCENLFTKQTRLLLPPGVFGALKQNFSS